MAKLLRVAIKEELRLNEDILTLTKPFPDELPEDFANKEVWDCHGISKADCDKFSYYLPSLSFKEISLDSLLLPNYMSWSEQGLVPNERWSHLNPLAIIGKVEFFLNSDKLEVCLWKFRISFNNSHFPLLPDRTRSQEETKGPFCTALGLLLTIDNCIYMVDNESLGYHRGGGDHNEGSEARKLFEEIRKTTAEKLA